MDAETWFDCYTKLVKNFNRVVDKDQRGIYFDALKGVPGPTIRLAVQHAIRDAKHWPNVATLREYCTGATRDVSAPPSMECQECHGDRWVEAPPLHANGLTYENVVQRCLTCRPAGASGG